MKASELAATIVLVAFIFTFIQSQGQELTMFSNHKERIPVIGKVDRALLDSTSRVYEHQRSNSGSEWGGGGRHYSPNLACGVVDRFIME